MKLKKKQAIFLIIAVFFTACLLGSCSKKNTTDLFGNKIKKGKLEPVTLTVYVYGWGEQYQAYLDRIAAEIEKRTRKTLNIDLNFEMFIPYQYRGAIKDLSTQNGGGDLMITGGDHEILDKAIELGVALDISRLFPQYAPGYYERIGALSEYYRRNDGVYAIPNNVAFKNSPCVVVREDLFKRYADGPINSLEALEKFLENVHANEDKIIPMSIDYSQSILNLFANHYGYAILDSWYGIVYKWDDPEMKLMAWEDMPEFKDMCNCIYDWYRKGYLKKDLSYSEMWANYNETFWASWVCNQLSVLNLNAVQQHTGTGHNYLEFQLFPDNPGQQMEYMVEGFIVNANSANPERAIMLIEWLHANQKNYDLIRYGFKGQNYFLKGKQYYVPKGADITHSFISWANRSFLDIDYERTHIANSPDYVEKTIESYKDPAARPPHFGFRIGQLAANPTYRLNNRNQIEYMISNGTFNEKTLENYRKQMKEQGIDQLVAEVQSQLDTWRKKINAQENSIQ